MSGLPALFLLVDGVMKLFKPPIVVEATVELGYPESVIVGLGVTLLTSTLLYLIPRTSILGATIARATWTRPGGRTHVRLRSAIINCRWLATGITSGVHPQRRRSDWFEFDSDSLYGRTREAVNVVDGDKTVKAVGHRHVQ